MIVLEDVKMEAYELRLETTLHILSRHKGSNDFEKHANTAVSQIKDLRAKIKELQADGKDAEQYVNLDNRYTKMYKNQGAKIPNRKNGKALCVNVSETGSVYRAKGNGKQKLQGVIDDLCGIGAKPQTMRGLICNLVIKYN